MNTFGMSTVPKPVPASPARHATERLVTTSDGVRLFVKICGSGPACLYIHGGPGAGSAWVEDISGPMLEKRFTMVYLDQRGCGRSTSPSDDNYSQARMLADFETVRTSLGFSGWFVMGHAFAGIQMTEYAKAFPLRIRGLVMINCTLFLSKSVKEAFAPSLWMELGEKPGEALLPDSTPDFALLSDLLRRLSAKHLLARVQFRDKASAERMAASYRRASSEGWNHDLEEAIFDNPEYLADKRPLCRDIAAPVLFFHGSRDNMVGPRNHEGVEFPRMLRWKSPCGHFPFLEDSAGLEEALDRYLGSFFGPGDAPATTR